MWNSILRFRRHALLVSSLFAIAITNSCSGGSGGGGAGSPVTQIYDICGCVPSSPPSNDHRHDEKHVPLTSETPIEITVGTVLGWAIDPALLPNGTPRGGRELQMFHIPTAYVQSVKIEKVDCDFHFEVSDVPDKNAPRVIVETPVDSEYCSARQDAQKALITHNVFVSNGPPIELNPPVTADITGLAFEDFNHTGRGSSFVATIWEIHPAVVKITE